MNVRVRVDGTGDLIRKLRKLDDNMSAQALANATRAGALLIEGRAKELAPVRTGTLRRSIHTEIAESTPTHATVLVGTDTFYAPFQEFGTRFMRAHPFLRPALDEMHGAAQKGIRASLADLLKGV